MNETMNSWCSLTILKIESPKYKPIWLTSREMASRWEGLLSPSHHPDSLCSWLNQPINSCLNSVYVAAGMDLVHVHNVRSYRETWSGGESTIRSVSEGKSRGPLDTVSLSSECQNRDHPALPTLQICHATAHTQSGRLRGWRSPCPNVRKRDTSKLFHVFLYATSGHILITNFPFTEKKWSRKYAFI